jgi:hypothetical protein
MRRHSVIWLCGSTVLPVTYAAIRTAITNRNAGYAGLKLGEAKLFCMMILLAIFGTRAWLIASVLVGKSSFYKDKTPGEAD